MSMFELLSVVITVTALLAFINERWLRLPMTIGVTAGGLLTSLVLIGSARIGLGHEVATWAEQTLNALAFDDLLMHGLLGVLLFAGALKIDLVDLRRLGAPILVLATVGVLLSTAIIGVAIAAIAHLLRVDLPLSYALLFGALISPTDPIAVLSILRRAGAPRDLSVIITSESLLNDGVGVVVFTMVLAFALGEHIGAAEVAELFLHEAVGGAALGILVGAVAFTMLRHMDSHIAEIMVTLAVVTGGYALAARLHTSGPIAMVMAGLLIGNQGREFAMSDNTRRHIDTFWDVTDELLNLILFVLIGLEVLLVDLTPRLWLLAASAIPVALAGRFLSTAAPIAMMRTRWRLGSYTVRTLTWGGLRGGIAIALALSLPPAGARGVLLAMTYVVVIFSLLVQGVTVGRVARRAHLAPGDAAN